MNEPIVQKISRRRLLIKRDVQVHFAIASFVLMLLSNLSVWYLMNTIFKTYFSNYWKLEMSAVPFLSKANLMVWVLIAGGSISAFLLSIFFSHLVAGPVYQMEKTFRRMLEGEPVQPIRLRKNDLLRETIQLLNDVVLRWNELIKQSPNSRK